MLYLQYYVVNFLHVISHLSLLLRSCLSPCGRHAPPAPAQVPLKEMNAFEGADVGKLLAEVKDMVKADRVSERVRHEPK